MFYFGVIFGAKQSGQQYVFNPTTGQFTTTPAKTTPTGFGFPGATPSVSSSGSTNGIVWALDNFQYGTRDSGAVTAAPAFLHAYSATDLSNELWNSTQGSGNAAGFAVKFTVPTVANGKVYIGTRGNDTTTCPATIFGELDVYGLPLKGSKETERARWISSRPFFVKTYIFVVRSAAAFRDHPINDLVRVGDVTGFVHAICEVDLQSRAVFSAAISYTAAGQKYWQGLPYSSTHFVTQIFVSRMQMAWLIVIVARSEW
jgi:outer membrane protein assembly factor BamB